MMFSIIHFLLVYLFILLENLMAQAKPLNLVAV